MTTEAKVGIFTLVGIALLGFIVIVLAIGALGLVSMRVAKTDSDMLAEQYLPETAVANDLERLLLTTVIANLASPQPCDARHPGVQTQAGGELR